HQQLTLGIADCNDPGLFVSEAQGQLLVAVPMDDNVLPHLYEPVIRYLTARD
ncbi:phosphatase, partial [Rothia kristinae]|uniref:phosphatase n=1 Tax=Rothia kristinae TaxID=37923 RepID=UPI00079352A8